MSGNDRLTQNPETGLTAVGGATWVENWFRPTVTAAMLTCLVVAFVGLVSRIMPSWHGAHYVAFAFLVSWAGIQAERLLRRRGPDYLDRFRYRAVEVVVILVLLKLMGYVTLGWDTLWADIRRWGTDATIFLDEGFVMGGVSILCLWAAAIAITKNLYLLEVHPSEIPSGPGSPNYSRLTFAPGQRIDRQAVLHDIARLYFWGGAALLVFTGLARFDIPILYRYTPPPLSGLVFNVMIYFALGLALISQAHFSILQVSWRIRHIDVSPRLGTRWAWLALSFVALIMALALILPTGYSVGLPQAIAFMTMAMMRVISFVGTWLFYLIALLLGALVNALGSREGPMASRRPPPAQLPSLLPGNQGGASTLPLLELFKSVLFWGIFLAIVGYSVYHFLRERRGLLPGLESGLLGRLIAWLHTLWQGTQSWSTRARKAISSRLSRRSDPGKPVDRWRLIRLSQLSPRQQVRYFYLSLLRRAARIGHIREPQQTPYEYGQALAECLPELASEMTTLTQAFVEARYSQRIQDEQEADAVKKVWRRVRATLTRKKHTAQGETTAQLRRDGRAGA